MVVLVINIKLYNFLHVKNEVVIKKCAYYALNFINLKRFPCQAKCFMEKRMFIFHSFNISQLVMLHLHQEKKLGFF